MDTIKFVEEENLNLNDLKGTFNVGDTVNVKYKIKEGDKERVQSFKGVVIQVKGASANKTFTVRKISEGIGVERIFPFTSPNLESVQVSKRGKVRRSKLYYLRTAVGKKTRIKEKR